MTSPRRPPLGRWATEMRNKNVVMASHGRAPWYGPDGKVIEAYVIGVAGGSASGKVSSDRVPTSLNPLLWD